MSQSDRLNEPDAHALLARAATIDGTLERTFTLAELRAVALEAGISAEAFDRAALEAIDMAGVPRPVADLPHSQFIANVKALVIFWVALGMLTAASRVAGVDWPLRNLADVIAAGLGAFASHRLGARIARIGFIGLTAGLLIQWLLQLTYGIGVVQGMANQLAVLGAGICGAAGVAIALRSKGSTQSPRPSAAESDDVKADRARNPGRVDTGALKFGAA